MSGKLRVTFAALLLGALALAIVVSASPQLHDWLHKAGDFTRHECAATLLSSGSVDHSVSGPVLVQPAPNPDGPTLRTLRVQPVCASLEFSRLEHAPPARS
ncbi:MAG TPA: hypothetical protein VK474_10720 [Chthoniobacterales bacterium]|nr:hypothetical protein [Chthoniobacterales bacterium]